MNFKPYEVKAEDEDDEGIVESTFKFVLLGARPDQIVVNGFVKLPGLLIVQYLFFWNWKRVVDPHGRSVVLAGLVVMLALAGTLAFLTLND